MSNDIEVSVSDEMYQYISDRISDSSSSYTTPSEYIEALILNDMQKTSFQCILDGLKDLKNGRLSSLSIIDIANEN